MNHEENPKSFDEDKLEEIRDKFRGGPMRKIRDLAQELDVTPEELLMHARGYLQYDDYWNEGDKFDGAEIPSEFWDWFELVEGTPVPANKRGSFLSCAC